MDNEATAVQPEGQVMDSGQGSESSGLYDLSSIPEQLRPSVEPVFKQWEANVTKKFQEHADYRKQWEPYESLGLHDVQPDDLEALLQFGQIAQDEQQFDQWLAQTAAARGLFDGGEEFDGEEDYLSEGQQGFDPEMIQQMIQESVAPLYEQAQAQQQEAEVQQAAEEIQSQLDALHKEHGDFPDEIVCQLAMAYDTPDAVSRAFSDYQSLIAQAERGVVGQKLAEPSVPERGGSADTSAPEIKTFEDARAAAIARLRAGQA